MFLFCKKKKKKKEYVYFQPFVCPFDIHCDSEDKKIHLYLNKKFYGKLLYAILNWKELGELLHCFYNENKKNKKNVVIVMIMIIAHIAKN